MKIKKSLNENFSVIYTAFAGGLFFAKSRSRCATEYYTAIRNRKSKSDIKKIAANTGITETDIAAIRAHVFENKHDLATGHTYFSPSAEMALAWQRLEQGIFTELDVLLLRHELEELTIMKGKGYDYVKAHLFANEKYPWEYKKKGFTDGQIRKINAERIKDLL